MHTFATVRLHYFGVILQSHIADVGECLIGTHNCSQLCVELPGGFECNCSSGYKLQEDGVSCEGKEETSIQLRYIRTSPQIFYYIDIDECSLGTAGCNHDFEKTEGSFLCTCDDGYQLHHDDLTLCVGM